MAAKIVLADLIPSDEYTTLCGASRGTEGAYSKNLRASLQARIDTMPRCYETADSDSDPFACLHYFRGGGDWYIVELDREPEQH